jgi:hypothetical protein
VDGLEVWLPAAVRLTLHMYVAVVSSELGRGIHQGVPLGEDTFVSSRWAQ